MTFTGGLENAVEDAAVMLFRRQLAQQLRVDSLRASATVGLGHPMSSMSATELMAVLLDGHLRLDFSYPRDPRRDHLIFSKGRAWPLYYAMLKAAGAISDEELLGFPKFGRWPLGHSLQCTLPADVATGSMGPGLPIGVGLALAGRRLDRLPYRVWVLCGDSEMAEGSTWEAFCYAGREGLGNLTVVVDANRLDRAGEIMLGRDLRRARAFGWHAIAIDGHDVDAIDRAYREAATNTGRPTVIFARTLMSNGVKTVGDRLGRRVRASDDREGMIAELGWVPFASMFFSRAYDFARLAAISRANLRVAGSYADLAVGEDGTSRVAVEDFASLRAVPGSTILHPSDANQVPPLVAQMADRPGLSYMRTLRSKTVVHTRPGEDIRIGGSRLVRGSDDDDVTVVACGVTVAEAEEAATELERDGVRVRVIDCYSIKPIDADALRSAARRTAVIVTVEDHWPEGGLGEAVLSALADQPHRPPILRLAARDIPDMAGVRTACRVAARRWHRRGGDRPRHAHPPDRHRGCRHERECARSNSSLTG